MKKKVNPRRRPVTQADINKAKNSAVEDACELAQTIVFSVLRDKEGFTNEDLRRVWDEVTSLSESIVQGYVSVADLKNVLKQEAGIILRGAHR